MKIEKEIQTIDTEILANYILQKYGPMSHLKLQKLLYYTEAYHLAYFKQSLIEDEFEAWVHGPVCRKIYDNLKGVSRLYSDISFSENDVDYSPEEVIKNTLTSIQKTHIDSILGNLSEWTDQELEDTTHNEQPWLSARKGYYPSQKCEEIIDKDLMLEYYRKELIG